MRVLCGDGGRMWQSRDQSRAVSAINTCTFERPPEKHLCREPGSTNRHMTAISTHMHCMHSDAPALLCMLRVWIIMVGGKHKQRQRLVHNRCREYLRVCIKPAGTPSRPSSTSVRQNINVTRARQSDELPVEGDESFFAVARLTHA